MHPHDKSIVGNSMPAYPDPEPFGVPGPYWSTISHRYLEGNGVLPGPELMQELLHQHWCQPPQHGRSRGSAEDISNFHGHHTEVGTRHRSVKQTSTRWNPNSKRDSSLEFAQNRLALLPFLVSSSTEVHEGPLSHAPMLRHVPTLEDSPPASPSSAEDGRVMPPYTPRTREYCHIRCCQRRAPFVGLRSPKLTCAD